MTHHSELCMSFEADVSITNGTERLFHQKTAIVTGLGRGGTSAISAVLDALGVYMGPVDNLVKGGGFEWDVFAQASKPGDVHTIIAETNDQYHIWGCKIAGEPERLRVLLSCFRNPYVILVVRDPIAIETNYTHKIEDVDFNWEYLTKINAQYTTLFHILRPNIYPCLALSYERAIQQPTKAILELIEFFALDPTSDKIVEAVARLRPHGGYLRTVRPDQPIDIQIENNPYHYRP